MTPLLSEAEVVERIFNHIDNNSTDTGSDVWQEPVVNYLSMERFEAEIQLLRRLPVAFCPSAGLPEPGLTSRAERLAFRCSWFAETMVWSGLS